MRGESAVMTTHTPEHGEAAINARLRAPMVLVADEGNAASRSALAAVRALAADGFAVAVTTRGRRSLASASRYCARRVPVPDVTTANYADAIREELSRPGYLAAIPASDVALVALRCPGAGLLDKRVLALRAAEVGIPAVPECRAASGDELLDAALPITYPVVVKPVARCPGSPSSAVRVDHQRDLGKIRGLSGPLIVQPFLRGPMSAIAGVMHEGMLTAVVHQHYLRIWPRDCGVASAAVTVAPDEAREELLVRLLHDYDGIFQAQFVGEHLVDLNPRVYGSLPLAVKAGANLPSIFCRLLMDQHRLRTIRGRPGVHYRWTEGDLRHVAVAFGTGAMTARTALRALVPRRTTAHSVEDIHDLRPAVVRAAQVVGRLV